MDLSEDDLAQSVERTAILGRRAVALPADVSDPLAVAVVVSERSPSAADVPGTLAVESEPV